MKFAVSKVLTSVDAAPVAISDTQLKVKTLIIRSELGSTAVDSDSLTYATAAKIGSGGVLTIDTAPHTEIDLAETYVQSSGASVKVHVMALD